MTILIFYLIYLIYFTLLQTFEKNQSIFILFLQEMIVLVFTVKQHNNVY